MKRRKFSFLEDTSRTFQGHTISEGKHAFRNYWKIRRNGKICDLQKEKNRNIKIKTRNFPVVQS
jgi:hypothetical protein